MNRKLYFAAFEPDTDPMSIPDIEAILLTDDNATVAAVTLWDRGQSVVFTGSSKRAPGDVRNENAGQQLALGRALLKLGASLVQAGQR